jgi:hypothetical protein
MTGRSTTCTATPTPLVAAKEMSAYGWVTVGPADVRKAMLTEILDLDNPKTKEYREFFWGGIAPHRVLIAQERDVLLNPPQTGQLLNTHACLYAETMANSLILFGNPKDFFYSYSFKEK